MSEAEKLLSLFESRFQAFGQRIADFANLSTKYEEIQSKMIDLLQKCDRIEEAHKKSQENMNLREVSQSKFNEYMQNQGDIQFKKISEELLNQQKSIRELQDLKHFYNLVSSKCMDLEKRYEQIISVIGEHSRKHADLKSSFEQSECNLAAFVQVSKKSHENIPVLQDSLVKLEKILEVQKKELSDLLSELQGSKSKFESYHSFFSAKIDQKFSSVALDCEQKIKAISIPDTSHYIEKKELEELAHLIAISGLDSKNAISKSTIHEMQLQLMSKKIEGILIQLKSLEFSKG